MVSKQTAGKGLRDDTFPNPATPLNRKHRAPSLSAADFRLDCSEERIRLLKKQM